MPGPSCSACVVLVALVLVVSGDARAQSDVTDAGAEAAATGGTGADAIAPAGDGPATRPDAAGPRVTYRYDLATDLSLTLAFGTIGLASTVVDHELPPPAAGDPSDVFVLDRGVARRAESRAAPRHASDALLFGFTGLGALASTLSTGIGYREGPRAARRAERSRRFGIFVETLSVTNAATTLVKLAVERPRPYTYAASYDPANARYDDRLSYFSGHTSTVAAVAATSTYFAFAEEPGSARAYATLGTGAVATGVVATLRVRAGKHFPTDVLSGALVGGALGILVPHLHRRSGLALTAQVAPGSAVLSLGGWL